MSKLNPIFSFQGTFGGITEVHSKLYGKHMRRPRGTHKPAVVNEAFQKSIELGKLAMPVAKAIKDAIDPFREGFRDGSMWGRLLGLFQKHLRKHPDLNFSILETFELYDKIYLTTHYHVNSTVSLIEEAEPAVRIELSSKPQLGLEKYEIDSYQQTLIGIFLNADLKATTYFEKTMLPLEKTMEYLETIKEEIRSAVWQKQMAEWPIPAGTKTVLIAMKCEPYRRGERVDRMKIKGMKILKVINM